MVPCLATSHSYIHFGHDSINPSKEAKSMGPPILDFPAPKLLCRINLLSLNCWPVSGISLQCWKHRLIQEYSGQGSSEHSIKLTVKSYFPHQLTSKFRIYNWQKRTKDCFPPYSMKVPILSCSKCLADTLSWTVKWHHRNVGIFLPISSIVSPPAMHNN